MANCKECGHPTNADEKYEYCFVCALELNDKARAQYNGERATANFIRLKGLK